MTLLGRTSSALGNPTATPHIVASGNDDSLLLLDFQNLNLEGISQPVTGDAPFQRTFVQSGRRETELHSVSWSEDQGPMLWKRLDPGSGKLTERFPNVTMHNMDATLGFGAGLVSEIFIEC